MRFYWCIDDAVWSFHFRNIAGWQKKRRAILKKEVKIQDVVSIIPELKHEIKIPKQNIETKLDTFEDNEETKADSKTEDIVGSEMELADDKVNSIQDEEGLRESDINEENINSNAASVDSKEINNDIDIIAINSEDSMEIPDNFIFPSFFVFVVWGPYADVNNRLNLTLVNDDNNTSDRETRKGNRKRSLEDKSEDSRNDNINKRGFTMVQQIELRI